ncbi:MAG: hypothetical protein ABIH65_03865 [Nanoarchaeota archaeon]
MIQNKRRGQSRIPNDPFEFIIWAIGLIIVIAVIGGMFSILSNIGCEDEKARISQLEGDLNNCLSKLQNQTELEQNLTNECNQRIDNATKECNEEVSLNINIIKSYRQFFVIYHIAITLSIILALNLFKGFLRFELEIENRRLKILFKGIKFAWIGIKWMLFVLSVLVILYSLFYLLFPHWFF